jgi:hypothetical protein
MADQLRLVCRRAAHPGSDKCESSPLVACHDIPHALTRRHEFFAHLVGDIGFIPGCGDPCG